jgi:hypothetical protein
MKPSPSNLRDLVVVGVGERARSLLVERFKVGKVGKFWGLFFHLQTFVFFPPPFGHSSVEGVAEAKSKTPSFSTSHNKIHDTNTLVWRWACRTGNYERELLALFYHC